jgi:hypothetical protein
VLWIQLFNLVLILILVFTLDADPDLTFHLSAEKDLAPVLQIKAQNKENAQICSYPYI